MKPHILLINGEDHENVHHPEIVEINDEVGIDMTIADELAPDHLVVGTETLMIEHLPVIVEADVLIQGRHLDQGVDRRHTMDEVVIVVVADLHGIVIMPNPADMHRGQT